MAEDIPRMILKLATGHCHKLYLVIEFQQGGYLFGIEVQPAHLVITEYGEGDCPEESLWLMDLCSLNHSVHIHRVERNVMAIQAYVNTWETGLRLSEIVKAGAAHPVRPIALDLHSSATSTLSRYSRQLGSCTQFCLALRPAKVWVEPVRTLTFKPDIKDMKGTRAKFKDYIKQLLLTACGYMDTQTRHHIPFQEGWPKKDTPVEALPV